MGMAIGPPLGGNEPQAKQRFVIDPVDLDTERIPSSIGDHAAEVSMLGVKHWKPNKLVSPSVNGELKRHVVPEHLSHVRQVVPSPSRRNACVTYAFYFHG